MEKEDQRSSVKEPLLPDLICPKDSYGCIKTACAIYNKNTESCAILEISESLNNLALSLLLATTNKP